MQPHKWKPTIKVTYSGIATVDVTMQISVCTEEISLRSQNASVCVAYREQSGNYTQDIEVGPDMYRAVMARGKLVIGWTCCQVTMTFMCPLVLRLKQEPETGLSGETFARQDSLHEVCQCACQCKVGFSNSPQLAGRSHEKLLLQGPVK